VLSPEDEDVGSVVHIDRQVAALGLGDLRELLR